MQMNRALGYYRLQFTRMIAIESKLLFTVYKVSVCPAKSLINSIFNWVTLVSARFAPDTFWINWLCAQSIENSCYYSDEVIFLFVETYCAGNIRNSVYLWFWEAVKWITEIFIIDAINIITVMALTQAISWSYFYWAFAKISWLIL